MLRANLIEPKKMILERVAEPEPGPGQVRLKIETCGVCGSDIHAYYGEHPFIQCPIAPGHEFSGTVEKLGPGVTGWQIGQKSPPSRAWSAASARTAATGCTTSAT